MTPVASSTIFTYWKTFKLIAVILPPSLSRMVSVASGKTICSPRRTRISPVISSTRRTYSVFLRGIASSGPPAMSSHDGSGTISEGPRTTQRLPSFLSRRREVLRRLESDCFHLVAALLVRAWHIGVRALLDALNAGARVLADDVIPFVSE